MSKVAPCPHLIQAKHNEHFYQCACDQFKEQFFDWKSTILFYAALHYVQALARQLGIDIGSNHYDTLNNIRPETRRGYKPTMPFSQNAFDYYVLLQQNSEISRYVKAQDVFNEELHQKLLKDNHELSQKAFTSLKKYLTDKRKLNVV